MMTGPFIDLIVALLVVAGLAITAALFERS